MADWTSCPHCNLKHSARADGLCPRCRKPVSSAAAFEAAPAPEPITPASGAGTIYAPPPEAPAPSGGTMFDPAAAPAGGGTVYNPSAAPSAGSAGRSSSASSAGSGAVDGVPLGARIAGGILVLNAIALMAGGQMTAIGGGSRRIGSVVIDVILGIMVMIGNEGALKWTKIRVVLGAVIFTGILIAQGDMASMVFQIAFSAAILTLLIGEARGLRLGLGLSAAAFYFVVAVLGMGQGFFTRMTLKSQVAGDPVTRVEGDYLKYHLTMPANQQWYLRETEAARKDNPVVDIWLVRPDSDAHVITIVEELEDEDGAYDISLDDYTEAVIQNGRASSSEFQVVEQSTLARPVYGKMLHTVSVVDGLNVETYYGLFVHDNKAYQIMAFAEKDSFPSLKGELKQAIDSFELPTI
ncbi:MAG TPA: hypothetical protein VF756_07740 [Thermoanaerobaculia bacterium]